jgi:hypothetical protein
VCVIVLVCVVSFCSRVYVCVVFVCDGGKRQLLAHLDASPLAVDIGLVRYEIDIRF